MFKLICRAALFVILFMLLSFSARAQYNHAWVDVWAPEPLGYGYTYIFQIYAGADEEIRASSICLKTSESYFTIDSARWGESFGERFVGGSDDRGLIDFLGIHNYDTIGTEIINYVTLGFISMGEPYGPAFGPEDGTILLATCYLSFHPYIVPIPEFPLMLWMDSVSIPWGKDFVFSNKLGASLIPDFASDTIDIIWPPPRTCGDVNWDFAININDVICICEYVFIGGQLADFAKYDNINCDGTLNISDAIRLANYIYASGLPPCQCGK